MAGKWRRNEDVFIEHVGNFTASHVIFPDCKCFFGLWLYNPMDQYNFGSLWVILEIPPFRNWSRKFKGIPLGVITVSQNTNLKRQPDWDLFVSSTLSYPFWASMGRVPYNVYLPIHGWLISYGINVGKYTIHRSYGIMNWLSAKKRNT